MELNKKGCFDSRIDAFATLMNTNKRELRILILVPLANSDINIHACTIGKHISLSGIHMTLPQGRYLPQN